MNVLRACSEVQYRTLIKMSVGLAWCFDLSVHILRYDVPHLDFPNLVEKNNENQFLLTKAKIM